jgi:hypothetical protein
VAGGFTEAYPLEEEAPIPSGPPLEASVPAAPGPREDLSGPLLAEPAFDPPLEPPAGMTPTPVSAPHDPEEEAGEEDLPWAEALEDDDPIITPIPPEAAPQESDLPEADALFEESLHFAKDPADSAPTLEPALEPSEPSKSHVPPEPAPDASFSESEPYPSPEAIPDTFSRPSRTEEATWHTPAPGLDPEVLRQALEKVAWEAFGPLSKEIVEQIVEKVERIAWEVIPQLAERLILEEIARLRDEPPSE